MENQALVFVYAKDGKIKVLTLANAVLEGNKLKDDSWKHTETLDVIAWIEGLHNGSLNVIDEINSLSGRKPKSINFKILLGKPQFTNDGGYSESQVIEAMEKLINIMKYGKKNSNSRD